MWLLWIHQEVDQPNNLWIRVKILNPKQVVYISCDPTTQIRDIQYFKKIGYHTNTIYLYDMFPHTRHVESICLLSAK